MPPKRKTPPNAVPENATTARSTRSSARTAPLAGNEASSSRKTVTKKTTGKSSTRASTVVSTSSANDDEPPDTDVMEVSPPPAKRARTTGASRKKAVKGTHAMEVQSTHVSNDDESAPTSKPPPSPSKPNPDPAKPKALVHVGSKPKASKKTSTANEPYTAQRSRELFNTYADKDDAAVIGPEGFEKLCADAGISMEGTCPLILAWLMGAKEMGKITVEEWTAGTSTIKVSSVERLGQAVTELEATLIEGKPPVEAVKTQGYDRTLYLSYASDPQSAFQKLYQFSFALVKPEQSKNIDMETSVALWTVLLGPKYPIMTDILTFISEKGTTYRATNKDLWSMMLEFCVTVSPTLENYEADGAWPTLLDDFVVWKKSRAGNDSPGHMET